MRVVPMFKPEFLRDLFEILGKPSYVEFIVSGREISEAALKIGDLEGVKLENRYVGGAPVHLRGEASIDKIIEIYKKQYEHLELFPERYKEVKPPSICIKEIYWSRWRNEESEGYRIKFDGYDLEIEIDPKEERIISEIIKCAKKHDIEISIKLRQR